MRLKNGQKLTCAGDEPLNENCFGYAEGSDWLVHEAFCLYSQRDQYDPYEKHHSTVREACELAAYLNVPILSCTIPRMTTSNAEKPSIQQKADCIIKEISMCQTTWNV